MIDRRKFLRLSGASLATAAAIPSCAGTDKVPTEGVPRSRFDDDSTAVEVTEGIDLSGKLAVVTGCTSGIGFETMRVLAMRGAHVVGTSRSLDRAEAACLRVPGTTTPLRLELSDLDSVVECANAIRNINSALDILVCNAGYLGGSGERLSVGAGETREVSFEPGAGFAYYDTFVYVAPEGLARLDATKRHGKRCSAAVAHLHQAFLHWKLYSRAYTAQYKQPVLYNRVGWVDIPALSKRGKIASTGSTSSSGIGSPADLSPMRSRSVATGRSLTLRAYSR